MRNVLVPVFLSLFLSFPGAASPVCNVLRDVAPDSLPVLAVIGTIESGLNPHVQDGAAGEVGVFQILPRTAQYVSALCGIFGNPRDLRVNTRLAACYWRYLLHKASGDELLAVASYNAGPRVMDKLRRYEHIPNTTAQYLVKYIRLRKLNICQE